MPDARLRRLTPRQQAILEFLRNQIRRRGYGPTIREIGAHFGIGSPNGVICHLRALESKGLITRETHRARAIRLSDEAPPVPRLAGRVVRGGVTFGSDNDEPDQLVELLGADVLGLRVEDDSLSDDGIEPGDLLLIRQRPDSRAAQTVVVRRQDGTALLARTPDDPATGPFQPLDRLQPSFDVAPQDVLGAVIAVVKRWKGEKGISPIKSN